MADPARSILNALLPGETAGQTVEERGRGRRGRAVASARSDAHHRRWLKPNTMDSVGEIQVADRVLFRPTSHQGFRNDRVASQIHRREFTAGGRAAVCIFIFKLAPVCSQSGNALPQPRLAGREIAPVEISGRGFGRPKPRMERSRDLDKR
eukprot:3366392-Pleurochrysis_carterae.AAC.1